MRLSKLSWLPATIAVLLFWHTLCEVFPPSSYLKGAGPLGVANSLVELAVFGDVEGYTLLDHISASLVRVFVGFGVACAAGIPLGLAFGLWSGSYDALKPVVEPLRFIPPIAWIPLAIILLTGLAQYAFVVWLGSFFPILLGTVTGVRRVDPSLIDVAKSFGASEREVIFKVVIPGALPEIVAGMRIGLGIGWMCIVAAEMLGGKPVGLGRLILRYAKLLNPSATIAGMLVIGLIGLLMNEAFLRFERRLFRWRPEVTV